LLAMLEEVRRAVLGRGSRPAEASRAASTAEQIDREFPFPVAYCFRSMQTELSYSRKWLKLLEMYEVTLKYLTCTLLSALLGSKEGVPATLAPSLAGLGRPSTGIWHRACFALLKALRDAPDDYFVARYLRALGNVQVKRAQSASEQLVTLRNTTRGHGFIEE